MCNSTDFPYTSQMLFSRACLFFIFTVSKNVLVSEPLGTCSNITSGAVCSAVCAFLEVLSSVMLTVSGED